MTANSPRELFVRDIQDLFDAEKQAARFMPKMAKSVSDREVRSALQEHLEETREQINRLERVFESMGSKPRSHACLGMKGLVEEASEILSEDIAEGLRDAAVVAAGRKQENYEISAYETAHSMARGLGMKDAAQLLQQNLEEEIRMDRRLGQVWKRLLKEAGRMETTEGETNGRVRRSRQSSSRTNGASRSSSGSTAGIRSTGKRVSRATTDHEEIRRWAEERGAHPACVRKTGGKGDIGMIRLDFPGYSGSRSLEQIGWEDFFRKFDENRLALVYEENTSRGQKSNFNKLVKRNSVEGLKTRTAR